jgi:hypothetical protein
MRRTRRTFVGMLVLAGCVLETSGQGSTTANVGVEDSTSDGSTTGLVDATVGSTAVDPTLETGLDDPSSSSVTVSASSEGSTTGGDSTTGDDSTTGLPMDCIDDGDCPANWVCVAPDCINPDEGGLCIDGCGPAAPFCGADQLCHDGTDGDSCVADDQCPGPLCGPVGCQDGNEADLCFSPDDCGPSAPFCTAGQCRDGSDGDPCFADDQCAGIPCGPLSTCQNGDEGDPCTGPTDCGLSAPHCPTGTTCYDGSIGDPCNDDAQCNNTCIAFFCV